MTDETPIPDDIMQAARWCVAQHFQNLRDHDFAGWVMEGRGNPYPTAEVRAIARELMAERARWEAELANLKRLKSAYKAKNASKTRLLERVREVISDLVADIVDEGDRAYFGSTNDADALRDLATKVEGWKWDDILRQSDGDPYATIREQRSRADAAETELTTLRAENERLLESAKAEARKAGMMRAAEIIGLMRDSANEIVVEDPTPSNRREAAGLVKCITVVIEAIRAEAKGSGG